MRPHPTTAAEIADLEMRLKNYRTTRRISPSSMHRWCDTLIRDAEAALRSLTATDHHDRRPRPGSSHSAVVAADTRADGESPPRG